MIISAIEICVRFKVLSEQNNIGAFFTKHGIPYSNSWNIGDEIITPNGFHTGIYQINSGIMLDSGLGYNSSTDEHLCNLLELLAPHMEILKDLIDNESINSIFCIGITRRNEDRIGISLDHSIIQQIYQLGSEIDIDIL